MNIYLLKDPWYNFRDIFENLFCLYIFYQVLKPNVHLKCIVHVSNNLFHLLLESLTNPVESKCPHTGSCQPTAVLQCICPHIDSCRSFSRSKAWPGTSCSWSPRPSWGCLCSRHSPDSDRWPARSFRRTTRNRFPSLRSTPHMQPSDCGRGCASGRTMHGSCCTGQSHFRSSFRNLLWWGDNCCAEECIRLSILHIHLLQLYSSLHIALYLASKCCLFVIHSSSLCTIGICQLHCHYNWYNSLGSGGTYWCPQGYSLLGTRYTRWLKNRSRLNILRYFCGTCWILECVR